MFSRVKSMLSRAKDMFNKIKDTFSNLQGMFSKSNRVEAQGASAVSYHNEL